MNDADDVDDRIEGADLVQVNLIHRHGMDGGFRFREALEHRLRAVSSRYRERRPVNQTEDLRKAAMGMMTVLGTFMTVRSTFVIVPGMIVTVRCTIVRVLMSVVLSMLWPVSGRFMRVVVHDELCRRHSRAQHFPGVDVCAIDEQTAERRAKAVERQPGVEQCADGHISRNSGETVEIQQAAHSRPVSLKL
jgi:hypothetical protein